MDRQHYYVLTHSGKRVGSTVKEARNSLNVGGSAIKTLFELGVIKKIYDNDTNVGNYGTRDSRN